MIGEGLTCLNFWEASSLPAFRSGCHFNACYSGKIVEIKRAERRTIFLYAFLMSSSVASLLMPSSL
jgi:hypothetical protein